jgi:Tfp pilus assembly protein PilV
MEPIVEKSEQGSTLVETVIALVLLMIIGVGIAPLFVYAIRYNSAAAIRAGALAVTQHKLEQLRATPFSSCVSSNETISVGNPASGLQTYTVETTISNTSSTLKTFMFRVTPNARSTCGDQYSGPSGWMYGQVTVYTNRTSLSDGPNLG